MITKSLYPFHLKNFVLENGKPSKFLFPGGYYAYPANTSNGLPSFGGVGGGLYFADAGKNPSFQKYKYTGKELDLVHGLNTYDHGARQNYSVLGVWDRVDPMAEKYYNISPYVVCGNNPILNLDGTGEDWIRNNKGIIYYNPNVHSKKDLDVKCASKGISYVGKSYEDANHNIYRSDGSIMFKNEVDAYCHLWRNSNYFRKEECGFILNNGTILVMPDYRNKFNVSKFGIYGYTILRKGIIMNGAQKYYVSAQIHTHQSGCGDANPSYIGNGTDASLSSALGRPVFTMSHDGHVWYIIANSKHQSMGKTIFDVSDLLKRKFSKGSFSQYARNRQWLNLK